MEIRIRTRSSHIIKHAIKFAAQNVHPKLAPLRPIKEPIGFILPPCVLFKFVISLTHQTQSENRHEKLENKQPWDYCDFVFSNAAFFLRFRPTISVVIRGNVGNTPSVFFNIFHSLMDSIFECTVAFPT